MDAHLRTDPSPGRRSRVRRRRRRPWWRRRPARLIGPAVAVIGLVLLLDGAWAATSALNGLSRARADLAIGENELVAGKFEDAAARFAQAGESAREAGGVTIHPSAAMAGILPGLRDEVDAIQTLARATELAADTGAALVRTARNVGWREGALPVATTAGRMYISVVEAAEPGLDQAATTLDRGAALLRELDPDGLLGPVGNAVGSARAMVAERSEGLRSAATLAERSPPPGAVRPPLRWSPASWEGPVRPPKGSRSPEPTSRWA
jgi:hypothetical protein